jgi:hypothetical protein
VTAPSPTSPASSFPGRTALRPAGLRCAHLENPLGVAPDRVRLSWRLEGAGRGR